MGEIVLNTIKILLMLVLFLGGLALIPFGLLWGNLLYCILGVLSIAVSLAISGAFRSK